MPDGVSWGYSCSFWEEYGNGGGLSWQRRGWGVPRESRSISAESLGRGRRRKLVLRRH